MKLGAWSTRFLKSWPGDESRWGSVPGTNIRDCPIKRENDPMGVVSRTDAVVPEYLKRYSMQVNMPEQKNRCLNLCKESVRLHPKTVPAIDADRYLIRRRVNQPH
jgi:hypothetical protein